MLIIDDIKDTLHGLHCGHKSKIPICCILWYVTIWTVISRIHTEIIIINGEKHRTLKKKYYHKKILLDKYANLYHFDVQYVKCPICLIFKRKKDIVLTCDFNECKKCSIFHWS